MPRSEHTFEPSRTEAAFDEEKPEATFEPSRSEATFDSEDD